MKTLLITLLTLLFTGLYAQNSINVGYGFGTDTYTGLTTIGDGAISIKHSLLVMNTFGNYHEVPTALVGPAKRDMIGAWGAGYSPMLSGGKALLIVGLASKTKFSKGGEIRPGVNDYDYETTYHPYFAAGFILSPGIINILFLSEYIGTTFDMTLGVGFNL